MKLRHYIYNILFAIFGLCIISSCSEEPIVTPQGGLRVKMDNVSASVITRSTPSEIGKPAVEQFNVNVLSAQGQMKYQGALSDDVIHLPAGAYSVTASCGANPLIAIDAPYYVGETNVEVKEGEVAEASLTCRVANALVSVVFGRDADEAARFDRFYKSYALVVHVDDYNAAIRSTMPTQSVYFQAGKSIELEFKGVLRSDDREVSTMLDLSETSLPTIFKAADHAIVTLTLPDPESAAVITITKTELTEATMEETIPLSWLPVPQAKPEHRYDANGDLIGTDITFSNCYPGMKWKAVVTDGNGMEYRSIEGTGEQTSTYADNAAGWPYIPAGNYTATFYLLQDGKEPMKTGSRTFTVRNPELKLTTGGYTSYTKYLEGNVEAANACDAQTFYSPTAKLNVSQSLLSNSKYICEFTANISGSPVEGKKSIKSSLCNWNNVENLSPRSDVYEFSVSATFHGSSTSASTKGFITGLPARYLPPKAQHGWKFTSGGNCSFESTYMKLATTVAPTPKAQSPSYYCPNDVNVVVTTSASQNTGIFSYKYTLHFNGSGSNAENTTSRGNAKTFVNNGTLKAGEDYLITEYSYIAAGNYLQIYSLNVEYR